MTIECFDIDYDTDGHSVCLPEKLVFEVDADFDPALAGADLISDETGFCVNGFNFRFVESDLAFCNRVKI